MPQAIGYGMKKIGTCRVTPSHVKSHSVHDVNELFIYFHSGNQSLCRCTVLPLWYYPPDSSVCVNKKGAEQAMP